MANREKIIRGLGCCSHSKLTDKCNECPYFSSCGTESGSFAEIAHDALALLMPRILTLEELMGFDGAFLIEYNPSMLTRKANWAMFHFMDEKQVHIWRPKLVEHYMIAQYGVTWRCWNVRPIQEEMEAMLWNGSR